MSREQRKTIAKFIHTHVYLYSTYNIYTDAHLSIYLSIYLYVYIYYIDR